MKIRIFILIILFMVSGCDDLLLDKEGEVFTYEDNMRPPDQLEDGLEVSTLENVNIHESQIGDIVKDMQNESRFIYRGLLIAKDNKLVQESYFNGWNRDRKQDMRSATKSMTSAIVGIARDQGYISSLDENILDFFEYKDYENWDAQKAEMTIREFLQMRTGLLCNDHNDRSPGHQKNMYPTDDWVKFILDLPISETSDFSYCTGSPVTLGAVVSEATGKSFYQYAHENLWEPLGIIDYNWEHMPNGEVSAGGQIHMKPRDALKFGLLFLNKGVWNGKQIVSEEWIEEATASYGETTSHDLEYGYLWWVNTWIIDGIEIPTYFGRGNGGQMIVIVPDYDAVIVMTGGHYGMDWIPSRLEMVSRILHAFIENE